MESLMYMADTLKNLEIYAESQVAMQEARVIGKRAQNENITSPLHLHQQICACTKDTMEARRELDDHASTLHVRSKILLHGLLNHNGKQGTVLGAASNNRIGIQLQGEQRQVSIRILNIRYWGDPEQNCQTLYDKMAAKAQNELQLLRLELKIRIKKSGNKNINTARARYNLGSALWLSNKPLEITLAVEEFDAVIPFMTQREPNHQILSEHKDSRHGFESHNQLRSTRHPLSLALLEAPHGQMGRQIGHDTTLQRTPSHDGPRKGAHNHCQHDATWIAPPRATRFLQSHTTNNRSDHI